jgi:ATP-dependent helicase/nuclease subunit A
MSIEQLSLFIAEPTAPPPRIALPDDAARARIQSDLATNLLVEAGAGAGKTTEMVSRMVALVRGGVARAHQLAAVTFTRKAAAELRERFQTALEKELRAALERGDDEIAARLDEGLREIDRAFLGTIHAFCARLLRERPLDAGLDPGFRETLGAEEIVLRRQFWHRYLERLALDGDESLAELRDVGLAPQQLVTLFEELTAQPDVEYPAEAYERPNAGFIRRRIEDIMDRAQRLMPEQEPHGGWDKLQTTLRMLRFNRFVLQWNRDARFLDVLAELKKSAFKATKKQWMNGDAARAVENEFVELFEDGGAVNDLLRQWWAFRYPIALKFAKRAADAYERERIRAGTLNFQDLLMFAARLLRDSPSARRELSDRYRFLLVDEFQDTDPIQAEVLFLLASDEELDVFEVEAGERRPPFASWRHLTPRPGALFVVGDPKQSIYRFRRADMTLYQQVKRRFESFGAVVELTSNFRSRKPIEQFVNDSFITRFPETASEVQAGFAPMRTQPPKPNSPRVREGVFRYELEDPVNGRVPQLVLQDSQRIATYIADAIASGERRAGDFLLLTRNTRHLARYASALEARNVPMQVTGAGVGGPDSIELEEFRLLLRALVDPGDPTLVLAVLVGLFFGIDFEQLTQHAETWAPLDAPRRRAPFVFTTPWDDATTNVEHALQTLHRFWQWSVNEPADIAVTRIANEIGVLPFAAAGELGETRAGALLFALDAVRASALNGDASLTGALATLDAALDEDESEAPLEPGRSDVVRVMNLHKAKGLEAPVVILATPFGDWTPPIRSRVVRDEAGRAQGYVTVTEKRGEMKEVTLAQPWDWPRHEAEEQRFADAEDERLLYVAATRAAHELIIGCAANPNSPSPWRSFYPWLTRNATTLELPQARAARREELTASAEEMTAAVTHADRVRDSSRLATYRVAPVTVRKAEFLTSGGGGGERGGGDTSGDTSGEGFSDIDGVVARGTEWGQAVHDALEAAARGTSGTALHDVLRNILIAHERPLGETGTPEEFDELLGVVEAVRSSAIWQRAHGAREMLVEVPFALSFTASEYASVLGAGEPANGAPLLEVLDGRVDLLFREDDGWVIVDYKSDSAGERIPADLMQRYRGQLSLYRAAWEKLSGERVKETKLLFTATGAIA